MHHHHHRSESDKLRKMDKQDKLDKLEKLEMMEGSDRVKHLEAQMLSQIRAMDLEPKVMDLYSTEEVCDEYTESCSGCLEYTERVAQDI